jgi:hypothetical protein
MKSIIITCRVCLELGHHDGSLEKRTFFPGEMLFVSESPDSTDDGTVFVISNEWAVIIPDDAWSTDLSCRSRA